MALPPIAELQLWPLTVRQGMFELFINSNKLFGYPTCFGAGA